MLHVFDLLLNVSKHPHEISRYIHSAQIKASSKDTSKFSTKIHRGIQKGVFFDKKLVNKLKKIKKISDLRQLINDNEESKALVRELPPAQKLYILRIVYSSGRLGKDLLHNLNVHENILLKELIFAYSLIWEILKSLKNFRENGFIPYIKTKHIVGIMWLLVKISGLSILDAEHYAYIDSHVFSYDKYANGDGCFPFPNLNGKEERICETVSITSLLTSHRIMLLIKEFLDVFYDGSVEMNSLDLQQIIMMSCEPALSLGFDDHNLRDSKKEIPKDICIVLDEIRKGNIHIGDSLKIIANKHIHLLNDSQTVNTFISCYRKTKNVPLLEELIKRLEGCARKGILDITLDDLIPLLNAAKSNRIPKSIVDVVMAQLEFFQPTNNIKHGDEFNTGSWVSWNKWFKRASIYQLGSLCKALYNLNCSKRVLDNIDTRLSTVLMCNTGEVFKNIHGVFDSAENNFNSYLTSFANVIHLLAKNGFVNVKSLPRIVELIRTVSWDDAKLSIDVICDICWSMLTLKIDFNFVIILLHKVLPQLTVSPLKSSIKLLGGFYNYVGSLPSFRNESDMRYVISRYDTKRELLDTENCSLSDSIKLLEGENSYNEKNREDYIKNFIKFIKSHAIQRANEFEDLQCISNFMFYITSTIDNFTLEDYSLLCDKWIEIMGVDSTRMKIEALSQTMWSLQKNRIYNEKLLLILRQALRGLLEISSPGQLALCTYTLAYFNLLERDIMQMVINRLRNLVDSEEFSTKRMYLSTFEQRDIKFVCVLWAIAISNMSLLSVGYVKNIFYILSKINWRNFLNASNASDLRKILQIYTSIEVDLARFSDFNEYSSIASIMPENVIDAAVKGSKMISDHGILSVSQDKVRRALERHGVTYRGEYEVYKGIIVDFALAKNEISNKFEPDLIIEVDGPYHYNVACGECKLGEFTKQFGSLKLIPNGKTLHRNRILSAAGYKMEAIPWFEAHRAPLHDILKNILTKHKYLTS